MSHNFCCLHSCDMSTYYSLLDGWAKVWDVMSIDNHPSYRSTSGYGYIAIFGLQNIEGTQS